MNEKVLEPKDIAQINSLGIDKQQVEKQLEIFKNGIPFVELVSAASIENGILQLAEDALQAYQKTYENSSAKRLKFVPASGAASRMFKLLFAFVEEYDYKKTSLEDFLDKEEFLPLKSFFKNIENYAFYTELLAVAKKEFPQLDSFSDGQRFYHLVNLMLHHEQLEYAKLPKGLVPFHKYKNQVVSAFEEHLYEAAAYASQDKKAYLHFTVTPEHLEKFKETFANIKERVEKDTATKFFIDYSFQKKSTNTIAVNFDNTPFREEDGKILFRPGGHGALIENLNEAAADLIFIKNIDNVLVREKLDTISFYKKALAGVLLEFQAAVFEILKALDKHGISEDLLAKTNELLQDKLNLDVKLTTAEEVVNYLNKPIRVCGMVKNQGAPGGGPFWVKDGEGKTSLQIVEGAQIDAKNPAQQKIAQEATHFNPVDLVCGVKNYKGEKFDLSQYVNPDKGFISKKSKNGKDLKALELPGLWNGAMAYWNTIFVEVPLISFNPVKTVVDLGKENHQSN